MGILMKAMICFKRFHNLYKYPKLWNTLCNYYCMLSIFI